MKYPIGVQTFREIIEEGYVYIDKTKSIYQLMDGKMYFLSRPRRFGKSLLISTLYSFFKAQKALFKGLYIEDKVEWKEYPVVHLSLNTLGILDDLEPGLHSILNRAASEYNLTLEATSVGEKLKELIYQLSEKGKVVLLIDEYDKPLISHVENTQMFEKHRIILKSFYSVIKDLDAYLKFVFITGVSRFARVSIFSDLNNLLDISMNKDFCDICGYTEKDMHHYFTERISEIAAQNKQTTTALFEEVKRKYNGYNFYGDVKMYNPWSVLNFLFTGELDNYWFSSGTPTFLTKFAARFQTNVEGAIADKSDLEMLILESDNLNTLLYQTGYLTIDEEIDRGLFTLKHPNEEVSESFTRYLLADYTHLQKGEVRLVALKVRNALKTKNERELLEAINPIFANIPFQIFNQNAEAYYHSVIHLIFMLLHYNIQSEISTNVGRIDSVLLESNEVWIFEFKLNSSAQVAYQQILDNHYAEQYLNSNKAIYAVGVNFSSEMKKINEVKIQRLQ